MSWLSRIFGYVAADERKGIAIGNEPQWVIDNPNNLPLLLKALDIIIPTGAVLYIESTSVPNLLADYLEKHKANKITKVEIKIKS